VNIRRLAVFFSIVLLTLVITERVLATPDPPRVLVNHDTRQCDPLVYWRDECGEIILPTGWEFHDENSCPADYTVIELSRLEWDKYQNAFCCQNYGGMNCPETLTIPAPSPSITPSPKPESPPTGGQASEGPQILPVAGGLSLLTGLGLGIYGLLSKRRAR